MQGQPRLAHEAMTDLEIARWLRAQLDRIVQRLDRREGARVTEAMARAALSAAQALALRLSQDQIPMTTPRGAYDPEES